MMVVLARQGQALNLAATYGFEADCQVVPGQGRKNVVESAALIKKLQIKAGLKLWLINVPHGLAEALSAGAEVEIVRAGEPLDGVIAFAETPAEVSVFTAQILPRLPADGLLWFAYRKGAAAKASGLSRDLGWQALADADLRPVRSVAIDENWTGLRFKPVGLVKSAKPDAWRNRHG
jgi:hypothetical protein